MEKIEVTARFDPQGNIIPLHFLWQERAYKVDSIGRNWQAGDGYHVLVMTPSNQAFHLVFKPEPPQWFLVITRDAPTDSLV